MSKKTIYTVIVGNVGEVFVGHVHSDAKACFDEYVRQSDAAYGRAAGESVTLMRDDEPIEEYFGRNDIEPPDAADLGEL